MTLITAASTCMLSLPATAQDEDFERIVTIMRACAQIADMAARVTCYDNNIAPRSGLAEGPTGAPAPVSVPVSVPVSGPVSGPDARAVAAPEPVSAAPASPQEFGRETLVQSQQQRRETRAEELETRVLSSRRVAPGIYELTLADDVRWRFVDNAPSSYDPPSAGSQVRIERGSLGSFFLHYAGQRTLRIRRVS